MNQTPVVTIKLFRSGEMEMQLEHGGKVPKEALALLPELLEDAAKRLRESL